MIMCLYIYVVLKGFTYSQSFDVRIYYCITYKALKSIMRMLLHIDHYIALLAFNKRGK